MKAGSELDKIVAEKVMGRERMNHCDCTLRESCYVCNGSGFMPYSTDIAAAWEVVRFLAKSNRRIAIETLEGERAAAVFGDGPYLGDGLSGPRVVDGDSVPHAICLAALESVGHQLT